MYDTYRYLTSTMLLRRTSCLSVKMLIFFNWIVTEHPTFARNKMDVLAQVTRAHLEVFWLDWEGTNKMYQKLINQPIIVLPFSKAIN
jgi:hypothetical protein